MNIIISNNSSIPIYEQIETAIKQAIFSNELKEDEVLPSVRTMANDLELIREEKLKEIQELIEKIYDISKVSNISEQEVMELFKIIFKGDF